MSKLKFGDETSIAAAAASPVQRMYVSFGTNTAETCGTCAHFEALDGGTGERNARCSIFERTGHCSKWSAASQACGKWELSRTAEAKS